jgi:hypothetical protein
MSLFYCPNCGLHHGFSSVSFPSNLTGNTYQKDKYLKHTNPTASYGINSTYDDPKAYCGYAFSASSNGFYELDSHNRINWVWDANKRVGETTDYWGSATPNSGVKFVHPNDPNKIHSFPTALPPTVICSKCGCVIKS